MRMRRIKSSCRSIKTNDNSSKLSFFWKHPEPLDVAPTPLPWSTLQCTSDQHYQSTQGPSNRLPIHIIAAESYPENLQGSLWCVRHNPTLMLQRLMRIHHLEVEGAGAARGNSIANLEVRIACGQDKTVLVRKHWIVVEEESEPF